MSRCVYIPLLVFLPLASLAEEVGPAPAGPAAPLGLADPALGAPRPPRTTFTGKEFPPPGSPADQALLGELLVAHAAMLSERAWAITATRRLADGGYDRRLSDLAVARPPRAVRIEGVRQRLKAAWDEVSRIMNAPWLVDGRIGCRPSAIEFEVHMAPEVARRSPDLLQGAAARARRCLERQRACVDPLERANRALYAAAEEAERLLGAAPGDDRAANGER